MLKNKNAIYYLVPVNIIIWGFFIVRFYHLFKPEGSAETGRVDQGIHDVQTIKDYDYALSLKYKDPFLKDEKYARTETAYPDMHNAMTKKNGDKQNKNTAGVVNSTTIPVPAIKYLGLITNNANGNSTALIMLNGHSKIITANEVIDGITFKAFNSDSLIARWGKDRIVVLK